MNEVQAVCAHLLDGPEPPLRAADEVLELARRHKKRRGRLTAAAAAGTVSAMVLAVAMVVGPGQLAAGPASVPQWAIGAPSARAAASHGQHMAQLLQAAVPAQYASAVETSFSDSDAIHPTTAARAPAQLLAGAEVRVFAGSREGRLYAFLVYDGRPLPSGELCAADLVVAATSTVTCAVRYVGGVPISVVTAKDGQYGAVFEATRYLNGGKLIVGARQGVPVDRAEVSADPLPLAAPLLDATAIAWLAGDPGMLPD